MTPTACYAPCAIALAAAGCLVPVGDLQKPADAGADAIDDAGSDASSGGGPLEPRWIRSFGGGGTDRMKAVAVVPDGSLRLAGTYVASIDFGDGGLPANSNQQSIFVAARKPSGEPHWSFGATGGDLQLGGLATDASGASVIVGGFRTSIALGRFTLTTAGDPSAFVAKLSPEGDVVWANPYGGTGIEKSTAVVIDGENNIIVAGQFNSSIDFGKGSIPTTSSVDVFVAKFSPGGGHSWTHIISGLGQQRAETLAVGSDGDVVVGGSFEEEVADGDTKFPANGVSDAYVVRISATGSRKWTQPFGVSGTLRVRALFLGADAVHVSAHTDGTVDFGGGPLSASDGSGAVVAELDPDSGDHLFSRIFGGEGYDAVNAVAIDAAGNRLLAGEASAPLTFGEELPVEGQAAFLAELDNLRKLRFGLSFGGADGAAARALALGPGGSVVVGGDFAGGFELVGEELQSVGDADVFLLSLTR